MTDMIELHCRKCLRSVEFQRSSFPDVPAWVARLEHDKCNLCDDGDRSAEHWIDADGREPDPLEMERGTAGERETVLENAKNNDGESSA